MSLLVAADAPTTPTTTLPPAPVIRTPKPAATPRINGPKVFGVRPGSLFLYSIPATGNRPMTFAMLGLPRGLKLDAATGRITGVLKTPGEYKVTLRAKNALGKPPTHSPRKLSGQGVGLQRIRCIAGLF